MLIKLDACQDYFTTEDPLYRLNGSKPLNAEQIGRLLKKMIEVTKDAKARGMIVPKLRGHTYFDFGQ
jgi:hypothetical protein